MSGGILIGQAFGWAGSGRVTSGWLVACPVVNAQPPPEAKTPGGKVNQRRLTTLSLTRGSRRVPQYWLAIGSSVTIWTSVASKPLNAVFIAAP